MTHELEILPSPTCRTLTSEKGYHKVYDFYMKPYAHAQPYLIGILVAYLLRRSRLTRMRIHWVTTTTKANFCSMLLHFLQFQ